MCRVCFWSVCHWITGSFSGGNIAILSNPNHNQCTLLRLLVLIYISEYCFCLLYQQSTLNLCIWWIWCLKMSNISVLSTFPSFHYSKKIFCLHLLFIAGRTSLTMSIQQSCTRLQVLDPVPFRETPEPRNDDRSPLDFRMAPVIGELSPKANNASVECRWHREPCMTSIDVLPGILILLRLRLRHITTCVTIICCSHLTPSWSIPS